MINSERAILSVKDLKVVFSGFKALKNVNLDVGNREIVTIIGPNGAGKSTFLDAIFDLKNITRLPIFKRARAGISYIPQGREIIPYLSVLDNLKLGMSAGKNKSNKISHEIFEFFPMLKQHLNRQGGLPRGGQQQQLAIARGLISEPKIMLLDEPTEGIQPSIVQEIEETLKRINREKGITLIVVEQKVDFVRQLAQKFFIRLVAL